MAARFCAGCGNRLEVQAQFCHRCVAPVNPNAPISLRAGFVPSPVSSRRAIRTVTLVVVVAAIVVVALFALPIPRAYSFAITEEPISGGWTGETNRSFPIGSRVAGDWNGPAGALVQLRIVPPNLGYVYQGVGSSGSFSFSTEYSSYLFVTNSYDNETISISGTYSLPIL